MIQSGESKPSLALGALLIILAFACVAVMSALGKAAKGVSTGTLVFFQNFILFAPWTLRHGPSRLRTGRIGLHILRAAGGLLSQFLMFAAVRKMPLVSAVLFSNSAALFIPLISWVWLKDKISGMIWISLLIGFLGVVLILDPSPALLSDPAALIAISAAVFSAFAVVSVNQFSSTEPSDRILFHYFLFSSLAAVPFVIFKWTDPTPLEWLFLAGIGVTMALSQLLIILAYKQASAERIAPFNYTVVIFSGLIGWVVWNNEPGLLALAGVVLVMAGGILSTKFGGQNSQGGHLGWIGYWNHLLAHERAA